MNSSSVFIKDCYKGIFVTKNNSPLIDIIKIVYTLYLNLENKKELKQNNIEWIDFLFDLYVKTNNINEKYFEFTYEELYNLSILVDHLCNLIIELNISDKLSKIILEKSDYLFETIKSTK
jgi:hypothetical protein